MKKIFIASDHAGVKLKSLVAGLLSRTSDVEVIDLGPQDEKSVDYPDYAASVCKKVLDSSNALGILICGSGQGMAMSANKFKGIRAALCWDTPSAQLSRQHNNANVLCLGARLIPEGLALQIVEKWLTTSFEGGRHQNRVAKIGLEAL